MLQESCGQQSSLAVSWGQSCCSGDPLTTCRMHSLSKRTLVLPHSSLFSDLV